MRPSVASSLTGVAFLLLTALAMGGDADGTIEPVNPALRHSAAPLPGDSLYQLPITLTTAGGKSMKLAAMRGRPALIAMFYSECTSVCPLLTMQLQRITRRLSASEQRRLRVLMVSFDSVRDTPESLSAFAREHDIAGENWIVARASAGDVRALAAALSVQYRELPDHTFNHSTLISLADRDGVIRNKTSDLNDVPGDFMTAVRRELVPAAALR